MTLARRRALKSLEIGEHDAAIGDRRRVGRLEFCGQRRNLKAESDRVALEGLEIGKTQSKRVTSFRRKNSAGCSEEVRLGGREPVDSRVEVFGPLAALFAIRFHDDRIGGDHDQDELIRQFIAVALVDR